MNDAMEKLLARRSIRTYSAQPIEETVLSSILHAAISAPSAHDSRPWHFVVFTTEEAKSALRATLAVHFEADLSKAGFPPEIIAQRVGRSCKIFSQAPVLVVAFAKTSVPVNPLAKSQAVERQLTIQSVALAIGQLLLAASFQGVGGCWFAAPLFCPQQVCVTCGMDPTQWSPQALLTLGYPDQEPKKKSQPNIEDYIQFR